MQMTPSSLSIYTVYDSASNEAVFKGQHQVAALLMLKTLVCFVGIAFFFYIVFFFLQELIATCSETECTTSIVRFVTSKIPFTERIVCSTF